MSGCMEWLIWGSKQAQLIAGVSFWNAWDGKWKWAKVGVGNFTQTGQFCVLNTECSIKGRLSNIVLVPNPECNKDT